MVFSPSFPATVEAVGLARNEPSVKTTKGSEEHSILLLVTSCLAASSFSTSNHW